MQYFPGKAKDLYHFDFVNNESDDIESRLDHLDHNRLEFVFSTYLAGVVAKKFEF